MAHYCICPKCNVKFNRDEIQAVRVSARRYGHATCYPDNTDLVPLENAAAADNDLNDLKNYISLLFKEPNWAMINKQLKQYKEMGYTLIGIKKSLVYFYEVKGNDKSKANNALGIIPYIYNDAKNYYLALFMAQQANLNIDSLELITKEVCIKPPKQKKKKRLFKFLEESDE